MQAPARRGPSAKLWRGVSAPPGRLLGGARAACVAAGLAGAAVLVAAELSPLLHVRAAATSAPIRTVLTGAHHGYALLPIAAASVALIAVARRYPSRWAPAGLGALGLLVLLIALIGDLPAAQATGLVGSSATRFVLASSSPALGLYLETLGGVLLVLSSGLGLLGSGPHNGSHADIGREPPRNTPPGE